MSARPPNRSATANPRDRGCSRSRAIALERYAFAGACLTLVAACGKQQAGPDAGGKQCAPAYAQDFCPPQPVEVKCWGDGEGCGKTPSDASRAACALTMNCPNAASIPGVIWPGPIRDLECGRGFGTPWCFGGCPAPSSLCWCHEGMDLALRPGAPVYAIYDGTVVVTGQWPGGGVGAWLAVRHDIPGVGVVTSVYTHLAEVLQSEGDPVCAGERLGFVTQWDCSSQSAQKARTHFHFALWSGEHDGWRTGDAALPPPLPECSSPTMEPHPSRFFDPMCLLRDAPLAADSCAY